MPSTAQEACAYRRMCLHLPFCKQTAAATAWLPQPYRLAGHLAMLHRSLDTDRDGRVSFKQLIGRLYPTAGPDDIKALMALAQVRGTSSEITASSMELDGGWGACVTAWAHGAMCSMLGAWSGRWE